MITQGLTQSFKAELLQGIHDFLTDSFYLALYTNDANLSSDTTVYSPVGEVVSSGYTAGGILLTNLGINVGAGDACTSFANVTWTGPVSFVVAGGLIYNASKDNRAVDVLNFGMSYTVNNVPFTVNFPYNSVTTAPIILGGGIYGTGT
jgi:hypothetical protein